MKRLILILLVLSGGLFAGQPVSADTSVCQPDPSIQFVQQQSPSVTWLYFDPGVSTDCAPWNGSNLALDHEAEVQSLTYWVEQQERIGQTTNWITTIIDGPFVYNPQQLAAADIGQALYNLDDNVNITGKTLETMYRYRVVVNINGLADDTPLVGDTPLETWVYNVQSQWYSGPDQIIVRPIQRPGDLIPIQRPNEAPGGGLKNP